MKGFIPLCAVALVLLAVAREAHAQMAFVPDPASYRMRGPKAASGAVIWSHGRSLDAEDSATPTPDYIEPFRAQGWDAFRFNRKSASDSLDAGSRMLARLVTSLKMQGYRRVVLAGQSFGAFVSLIAADLSDDVDAVIATAPAAFGTVAEDRERGALNASRLYAVLERVRRSRIMLFYFKGDAFDPGGRASRSAEILGTRHLPYLVVDRPVFLVTHWAASTAAFARRYGQCIVRFASGDDPAGPLECRTLTAAKVETAPAMVGAPAPPDRTAMKMRTGGAFSGGSAKH